MVKSGTALGWLLRGAAGLTLLALAGCAELPYYWQSVRGHVQLLRAAQPVVQLLQDPSTPAPLRQQLALAQTMRRFAVTDLALPDNSSYQRYADLHRKAVVWNVVAASPWSLTLKTWCFPVMGCVGYRGYFDQEEANAQASALRETGLEVSVYGVPAYSTLGWLNWLGGDPLLNTFVGYSQGELARLIFHELAHQVLYVGDDTRFNESFATAVERLGSAQWMQQHATPQEQRDFDALSARQAQFRALVRRTRDALEVLYAQQHGQAAPGAQAAKDQIMQGFRDEYALLKAGWSGNRGVAYYDAWVAHANNAAFGAQAAYDDLVPQFTQLFMREAQGASDVQAWRRFFDAAKRLKDLPAAQRLQALQGA